MCNFSFLLVGLYVREHVQYQPLGFYTVLFFHDILNPVHTIPVNGIGQGHERLDVGADLLVRCFADRKDVYKRQVS